MISTDNPDEKIVALDYVGTFTTLKGMFKVLTITIKVERKEVKW